MPRSTTGTSTTTWARAHRSTRSTTSTPTISTTAPPPGTPRWGAAYRDYLAKSFTRQVAMVAQTENLPYADQMIDLDPDVKDAWGLPAPRLTYDWRRPNELARVEFMMKKMEEIGRTMGAAQVWRAPLGPG